MNDFTKEELQLIHEYLCGNPRTYVIADKIQSMIDNYCEHEWDIYREGSIIRGIYCAKCSTKLKGYK